MHLVGGRKLWTWFIAIAAVCVAGAVAFAIYGYSTDSSVEVANKGDRTIVLHECGTKASRTIRPHDVATFDLPSLHLCAVYGEGQQIGNYLGCLEFPATLPGGGGVSYPANVNLAVDPAACH